jgi:DNA methylase
MGQPVIRSYSLPGTPAEYRPDPAQAIDRWVQWQSSANAKTIQRILTDLTGGSPTLVVDPFCGAGSTAVAARNLGARFAGLDRRPEAVCVTTAKARGTAAALTGYRIASGDDEFTRACLAFVQVIGDGSNGDVRRMMRDDLSSAAEPDSRSVALWGDSADPRAWTGVEAGPSPWVGYTSPPFGSVPSPDVDERHALLARRLVAAHETRRPTPAERAHTFSSRTIAALENLSRSLGPGRLIVEHEPDESCPRDVADLARELNRVSAVSVVEVLRSQNFSGRGPLSLLVCDAD